MKTCFDLNPSYLASPFHTSKIRDRSHHNLGENLRWVKINPGMPWEGERRRGITCCGSVTIPHFLQLLHFFLQWLTQVCTAQLKMPGGEEIRYLSSFSWKEVILLSLPLLLPTLSCQSLQITLVLETQLVDSGHHPREWEWLQISRPRLKSPGESTAKYTAAAAF